MKKIYVVFILFFVIPFVQAQDVEIFGQNYSVILVIPLILILFLMVVFAGMIVYDTIKRRKKLKQKAEEEEAEEKTEPRKAVPAKETVHVDTVPKKPALKKKDAQKIRDAMIIRYLREIKKMGKILPTRSAQQGFGELSTMIRSFFSEFFNIKYTFTYEELEKELKKVQQDVVFFSENLSKLHYGPFALSKKEVMDLFYEFGEVMDTLVKGEQLKGKEERLKNDLNILKPFLKLMDRKVAPAKVAVQKPVQPKVMVKSRQNEDRMHAQKLKEIKSKRLKTLHEMVRYGQEVVAKDPDLANEVYIKLYRHYQDLPLAEKKNIHPSIIELYKELKAHL